MVASATSTTAAEDIRKLIGDSLYRFCRAGWLVRDLLCGNEDLCRRRKRGTRPFQQELHMKAVIVSASLAFCLAGPISTPAAYAQAAATTTATNDAAGKVTEKTKEGVSKTGEVITDSWITTRVKSKFLDESVLKGSDIHVETNDHVVTLTGTVPTQAGRARAVEQTKEVEGVHKVVDKLTVGRKK